VAASASEWCIVGSLALAATAEFMATVFLKLR
jgi:hypothetical protein